MQPCPFGLQRNSLEVESFYSQSPRIRGPCEDGMVAVALEIDFESLWITQSRQSEKCMYVRHFKPLFISRNPPDLFWLCEHLFFRPSIHSAPIYTSICSARLNNSLSQMWSNLKRVLKVWRNEHFYQNHEENGWITEGRVFFNLKLNSHGIGVNGGVNSRPLMVLLSHHRGGKGEVLGWGKNIISIFCPRISSLGNILVNQVVVKEDDQKKWTIMGSRGPWFCHAWNGTHTYFTDYFAIADKSLKMKILNSVLLIHSKWNWLCLSFSLE